MGILWKLQQDSLRRVVNLQVRKVDIHIDAGNLRGQNLNTVLLPARKKWSPLVQGSQPPRTPQLPLLWSLIGIQFLFSVDIRDGAEESWALRGLSDIQLCAN